MSKHAIVNADLSNLAMAPEYRGFVEDFRDNIISGWCLSLADPARPVEVKIYLNSHLIGTVTADELRKDINALIETAGPTGFRYDLKRVGYADLRQVLERSGDRHLDMRVEVDDHPLAMAPTIAVSAGHLETLVAEFGRTVTSSVEDLQAGARYRGGVDMFEKGVITGWCLDADNPLACVELEISLGDVVIGRAKTSTLRTDISRAIGFPVRVGFSFRTREMDSACLADLAKTLSGLTAADRSDRRLLRIRVADTSVEIPPGPDFKLTAESLRDLFEEVGRLHKQIGRNTTIRVRDSLLIPPTVTPSSTDHLRLIAFYLPQFHPFAENDEWWGTGFTEWTNVSSAQPSFPGHDQPRLPADFGYYDLRVEEVQRQQVEMAKSYGINAFCYHHYWFSGKSLMTMPVDRHHTQGYDLDFCICWANENWSRRWDGSENDVLLSQHHSITDDAAFIDSVMHYFHNPRYVKINGAPLLIVYRLSLLCDPAEVIAIWKRKAVAAGFPDLHVCMAETFGVDQPLQSGADSSCQFPPHGVVAADRRATTKGLIADFTGKIYDYQEVVANEMRRPEPMHLRFRTVMPAWDNTARKGSSANIFHGANPDLFEAWLTHVVAKARTTRSAAHQLVFINAWNEWAEGAYLEPDRRHGHANLRAVRNALSLPNAVLGEAALPGSSQTEDAFRRKVLRVVGGLMNANRQLERLIASHAQPSAGASPFVPQRPGIYKQRVLAGNAHFQIDSVNGHPPGNTRITLLRERQLMLRGWNHVPGYEPSRDLPAFIELVPQDGSGQSYIASIHDRIDRPDVGGALGLDTGSTLFGFSLSADLRLVEPGPYRVNCLLATGNGVEGVHLLASGLVLILG